MKAKAINIASIIALVLTFIFFVYGYRAGIFTDQAKMEDFLRNFGVLAPIIFIGIQALQVVIPVVPFAIGTVVGIIFFGPWYGFLYNYIGIVTGSILAFLIAKKYGRPLIRSLFGDRLMEKYNKYTDGEGFNKMFALSIFLPLAPDDFLCYLAGTTKMTLKFYTLVILLGKPLSLAIYSFSLNELFKFIL
ncbi:MAG: TVP38/TMEM64 family protein [Tissierellia bacterium]|nr:TVP38/TMEM64 family protein [Tissierellia bacterium]